MFKIEVAICLIVLLFNNNQCYHINKLNYGLTVCLDPKNPGTLAADQRANSTIRTPLFVRLPTIGFLKTSISCIVIDDEESSNGKPEIIQGGLHSNFVIIHVPASVLTGLNYRVRVYTKTKLPINL
ncbi:unnamed protein product [Phyllotreta striolata]|uniref:Uncharacterized protein n=1 Tax=Phyllotreta striolata TaxID=444603 RepID=A0A9N9XNE3_PHYSR|nr:unnamed protein product [Phyllotreta striolata]